MSGIIHLSSANVVITTLAKVLLLSELVVSLTMILVLVVVVVVAICLLQYM
ncbi:MAG: hypothetical protein K0S67_1986 [Nitrososphaeraceae archaeon]|nr:hypothetical protein [Nitrososphaeraceae archaeon]